MLDGGGEVGAEDGHGGAGQIRRRVGIGHTPGERAGAETADCRRLIRRRGGGLGPAVGVFCRRFLRVHDGDNARARILLRGEPGAGEDLPHRFERRERTLGRPCADRSRHLGGEKHFDPRLLRDELEGDRRLRGRHVDHFLSGICRGSGQG